MKWITEHAYLQNIFETVLLVLHLPLSSTANQMYHLCDNGYKGKQQSGWIKFLDGPKKIRMDKVYQ